MPRPIGVSITAMLMVANVCLDVMHALYRRGNAVAIPAASSADGAQIMLYVHVALGLLLLVEGIALAAYWCGCSWGRWAVLVGSLYFLVELKDLHHDWQRSHFTATLDVLAAVLAVYLLWYLHTVTVRLWFARPRASKLSQPTTV